MIGPLFIEMFFNVVRAHVLDTCINSAAICCIIHKI